MMLHRILKQSKADIKTKKNVFPTYFPLPLALRIQHKHHTDLDQVLRRDKELNKGKNAEKDTQTVAAQANTSNNKEQSSGIDPF